MSDPGPRTSDHSSTLPNVLLSGVYETLPDLSPLDGRFVDLGAPDHLARTWLTTVVLDGLALTAARAQAHFTQLAVAKLRSNLEVNRPLDDAVTHVMASPRSAAHIRKHPRRLTSGALE